jgi:hypothetical protein
VLLAGLGLLLWLIRHVGLTVIVELMKTVGLTFLLVAALYALHVMFRAAALYRSLPSACVSFKDVLRVRLIGEAIEMFTFTGPVFAEPAKGFFLTRRGLDAAVAFGAVATEYLLYTFVSSWIAVIALSILLIDGKLPVPLRGATVALVIGMSAFIIACVAAALSGVGLVVPAIRAGGRLFRVRRMEQLAAGFAPVERSMVAFLHTQPARLAQVVAIEAAGHALLVCEIWLVVGALGTPRSFTTAFVAEGAVKFISTVFAFVPGQLGASEGSYMLIFRSLGLPDAMGLTIALVRRLRGLLVAAVSLAIVAVMDSRRG